MGPPPRITDPPHLAFLSRRALSDWLRPRASRVQSLAVSHTETRAAPVGHVVPALHDLQASDLLALLSSLPSLTDLSLHSASNLLPDPAALVGEASTSETAAAGVAARAAAGAAAGAAGAGRPPGDMPSPPSALPDFATRLRRLVIRRAGYDLQPDEGAPGAAALGRLPALRELELGLEPPSRDGLSRLPETWKALSGLTALRLSGHRGLHRLPHWLPTRLTGLRELALEDCGFRTLPAPALAGLRHLRRLSMDRCPLGRADCAVSIDHWWPLPAPAAAPGGDGGSGVGGGSDGDAGAGADDGGGSRSLVREEDAWGGGGGCASGGAEWSDGSSVSRRARRRARYGGGGGRGGGDAGGEGGGGGVLGLEVLSLRECEIVALPYAFTQLSRLESLELGGNPLGALSRPAGLEGSCGLMRAHVLRYLRDSGDRGFDLLAGCPRLQHLGLDDCGLDRLPPALGALGPQLTSLDVR
ncbi:hypothetical protein GPECTOR_1g509 [Gonium pectorale]|uniref:Uncharacterized protein n=1 Tax=Gonium pectorale TaxID=33097 RepID=A0A150H314_GONPE|nr:hypothetical protein GPECTOR_1g509 [Gonium pectorale]|eukprot:KXZ56567.1 hypothetical protein GPECTOR_1g509 [Gonium pectorale]